MIKLFLKIYMPINKRKKNTRQKGSHTCGWGSKKKHRKAGNRGGRGMSGTGKRSDHKKTMILKKFGHEYFGKFGFRRPQHTKVVLKTINLIDLNKFKETNIDLTNLVSLNLFKSIKFIVFNTTFVC